MPTVTLQEASPGFRTLIHSLRPGDRGDHRERRTRGEAVRNRAEDQWPCKAAAPREASTMAPGLRRVPLEEFKEYME